MSYSPPLRNWLKNPEGFPVTQRKVLGLQKVWVEQGLIYAVFEMGSGKFKKVKRLDNVLDYMELMYWQNRKDEVNNG